MPSKLSICIPTYNRGPFLDEALASVLPQVTDDVEIVVSDNASTDNTREIVARYQQTFPRLRYFCWPENMGFGHNALKVVELAQGEYCWLLGSDDGLVEDAVVQIMPWLRSEADIIVLGVLDMSSDMRRLLRIRPGFKAKPGTSFNCKNPVDLRLLFMCISRTDQMFTYISCLIIKKETWNRVLLRDELINYSAWIHVIKCFAMIQQGCKVLYIGKPLVLWRSENDSFLTELGYIRRRLIDFDLVRIAKIIFYDKPKVIERILVLMESHFSWRCILRDKIYISFTNLREEEVILKKTYHEYFASQPGYKLKMTAQKIIPNWLLFIIRFLYQKSVKKIFPGSGL